MPLFFSDEDMDLNKTQALQELQKNEHMASLNSSIEKTLSALDKEGVLWQKSYDSYRTYLNVTKELDQVRKNIKKTIEAKKLF